MIDTFTQICAPRQDKPISVEVCMKGSVFFQRDRGRWAVSWPRQGARGSHVITRYKGEFM